MLLLVVMMVLVVMVDGGDDCDFSLLLLRHLLVSFMSHRQIWFVKNPLCGATGAHASPAKTEVPEL